MSTIEEFGFEIVNDKGHVPHEYQHRGCDYVVENDRAYLAADMGVGKTLMTLMAIARIKKPTLIVGPLKTIYNTWPDEMQEWGFPFKHVIVHGPDKELAIRKKADIYITNYETIPFIYEYCVELSQAGKPFPFEVLVLDEGSMVKNHRSKRFDYLKCMRPLFPKHRVILSGTPSPNSLMDLWSQYFLLNDGDSLGKSYGAFRRENFMPDPFVAFKWDARPGAENRIHRGVSGCTFRLDANDYLKLPALTYNYIKLEMPRKHRAQYRELKNEFLLEIDGVPHTALNAASLSMKLRQFLQGFLYFDKPEINERTGKHLRGTTEVHKVKLNALRELVDDIGQPVLCAIQFKYELEMIRKVYPDAPVIAGGTSSADGNMYVKQWNKGEIPLLLCHPASLSHGVNLQSGGCNIVWYCQTWSLEQYQQFNKRLHRQGQQNGVMIHHLVFENTIDMRVSEVLARKDITQRALLDFLRDVSNYK